MIPLNKPYLNSSSSKKDLEAFSNAIFPERFFTLTFSARQSLSEIYKNLYLTNGPLIVAVSPLTCVEALYPIIQNGHDIRFVDINPMTLNMDEMSIPENADVVQAIHLGGNPQNMDLILIKNPAFIVEDCAQAFGSKFNSIQVGLFGDFSAFSFMKNMYSLGGGCLVAKKNLPEISEKNKEFSHISTLYRKAKRYFETKCSINSDYNQFLLNTIIKLKPENTSLLVTGSGINNQIRSSIGMQIVNYNEIIAKRKIVAEYILSHIKNDTMEKQQSIEKAESNYLRLFFTLRKRMSIDVIEYLRKNGIGANHLTQNALVYYQERFDKSDYFKEKIKRANLSNYFNIHDKVFSIPVSPALKDGEIEHIVKIMNTI